MKHCQWICRNCPKRLTLFANENGISLGLCYEPERYMKYVGEFRYLSIMHNLFAMDKRTGRFISPFEEFRDLFWRPIRYVEKRKMNIGDRKFFEMIKREKQDCIMLPEMSVADWNRRKK